jgi:WS/DGAT/MGAT family acyltransferase
MTTTAAPPRESPGAIRPLDLAFLVGESHAEPLHVGGLLVFDAPPADARWTPRDLVAAYRAARAVAPFDRVPEFPLLGQPRWRTRAELDMAYHVQHLRVPAPGNRRALCELVQELHGSPLDRGHPLFRIWVIEGIAGGGFALYAKLHHALVDGASGLMRAVASLATRPGAPLGAPFFAVMPTSRRKAERSVADNVLRTIDAVVKQARAAGDVSASALRKLAAAIEGRPEPNTPFVAPATPINRAVRNGRAIDFLSLPLDALRSVANAAGGTVNDVLLAIVDTAVDRYLAERHAAVQRPLVAMVPVSLRAKGDVQATTKAAAVVAALGEPGTTPRKRLARIIGQLDAAKAEMRAMSKTAAVDYAIAVYAVAQGLGGLGIDRPSVNFVVSNVPGPEGDLYLGGARLAGIYPVSALGSRVGLNATVFSQGGCLHLGLVADRSQLPDPERVAALCREALRELERRPRKPAPRKSGAGRQARRTLGEVR